MNKIKKILAFTLAELLLTLAIIGVVAAVVLPAIKNLTPNTEKAMFLKAYGVFTRTVHDMLNNEDLYPEDGGESGGFYLANTDEVTFRGITIPESDHRKFCKLFAAHLNVKGDVDCASGDHYDFETTDGIAWDLPINNFSGVNFDDPYGNGWEVLVDVNGQEKGPNKEDEDIFKFYLRPNGSIYFESNSIEEKYINESDLSLSKAEHN